MSVQKWLNWSSSRGEGLDSGMEGADKTGHDPVSPGLDKTQQENGAISVPKRRVRHSESNELGDLRVSEAVHRVAGLLAVACQRNQQASKVPANPGSKLAERALALSGDQSVHECD